jgi:hypothetical protein
VRVPGEAGGVVDEDHVEALLGGVGHQPLELRAAIGLAPARVEVGVLGDQVEVVLGGEGADRLALGVGGEALALLLGRLANVGGRSLRRGLSRVRHLVCLGAATSRRTNARRPRPPGAGLPCRHDLLLCVRAVAARWPAAATALPAHV